MTRRTRTPTADASSPRRDPKRWLIWPVVMVVLLLAGLYMLGSTWEPEPLSDEEILAKSTWTPSELTTTMAQLSRGRLQQQRSDEERRALFTHLRSEVDKLPLAERQQVVRAAAERVIQQTYAEWKVLPPEAQDALVTQMVEQGMKRREEFAQLSSEEKAEIRERISSETGSEWINKTREASLRLLEPVDRQKLAPVVKIMVENLETFSR